MTEQNAAQPSAGDWMSKVTEAAREIGPSSVEARKPRECAMALAMLAAHESLRATERATKISRPTLTRLRWTHAESIAHVRQHLAREAGKVAEQYMALAADRCEQLAEDPEKLAKVNPRDLAVASGIYLDKMAVMSGGPSAVVEHRRGISLADAQRLVDQATERVRQRQAEGRVIDSDPAEE